MNTTQHDYIRVARWLENLVGPPPDTQATLARLKAAIEAWIAVSSR